MQDELAEFLVGECELEELGLELSHMIHRKGSLSLFVSTILDYSGLFTHEEVNSVAGVLRQGGKMTDLDKQKMRIARLVDLEKYESAIEEYDILIQQVRENLEVEDWTMRSLLGSLLHNKGVVYARMMCYRKAAECFEEAQREDPRGEYQKEYLAAKRLELSDREYISLIADHPEYYEYSIKLEKETADSLKTWEESPEFHRLVEIKNKEAMGKKQEYHKEMDDMVKELVEEYRTRGGKE